MESEQALLARAREGDEEALGLLVERYAPRVLRFGLKLCRDEEDAREILQQTLLTVARKIRDFRGESRFTTWLFAIARSFCLKQRTRGPAAVETESLDETALDLPESPQEAPDERIANMELAAALDLGVRSLEPGQREVLVLRDVEGLSAAEVAEVLNLSEQAVKSRLHRARKNLRERLAPLFEQSVPAPGCPDVVELFSRYHEGEITREVCKVMEAHVADCSACAARCDSLRRVLSACSSSPAPELPDELKAAVRGQIRRALLERAP